MDVAVNIQQITSDNFEAFIHDNEIVIIDFWANWCAPCKSFLPIYDKVAAAYSTKIVFAQVDIEKEQDLAQAFAIRSVPHLLVFKKGIVIYSESGTMPESALRELAEQALTADVSDIVAKLDEGE